MFDDFWIVYWFEWFNLLKLTHDAERVTYENNIPKP